MSYPLSPINTVVLPEFQSYTDEFGLIVDNNQQLSSGNGVLYTGHYVIGLVEKGLITEEEKNRIMSVFESCERLPGLFMRSPIGQTNYEAHDDLLGIMGAESKLFPAKIDRKLSQAIYQYGSTVNADKIDPNDSSFLSKFALTVLNILPFKNKWTFNTINPGTFSVHAWLGLKREVVATMAMSSGNRVNPIDWLYWAVSMLLLNSNSSNNAYILAMHSCWAVEGYGYLTDWIVSKVQNKMKNKYGDFGKMLGTYFQDPNHPLIKLLSDIIV